ncbi:MAG: hypothetical protein NUV98_07110 [Candidatus Roizmanbacteria bacterium]|nr:hypothetical protein [Candidatus Roizmanbacteria bacterium]
MEKRKTVTFATIKSVAKRIAESDGITEEEALQNVIHAYGHENIDFSGQKLTNLQSLDFANSSRTDLGKTRPRRLVGPNWTPFQPT